MSKSGKGHAPDYHADFSDPRARAWWERRFGYPLAWGDEDNGQKQEQREPEPERMVQARMEFSEDAVGGSFKRR